MGFFAGGGIIYLICRVTSHDHLIEGSCEFIGETYFMELLKLRHHPTKFGGHMHCGIGDIIVLVYHVIWQDHVIKGSYDFIGRSPSS